MYGDILNPQIQHSAYTQCHVVFQKTLPVCSRFN